MTLIEEWAATEDGWKAWQEVANAAGLPDEEFWAEYRQHFTPESYGVTVEIEIEGYPDEDHLAAVNALLAEKGLTGHALGHVLVKDPGHHKAAGAASTSLDATDKLKDQL